MELKRILSAITLLTGMILSTAVPASTQATLQIRGTIKPAACDIRFDGGGILDWQQISAASLSSSKSTPLTTKNIKLNISCETPTLFAVRARDIAQKAGEAKIDGKAAETSFSLGATEAGKNIGAYRIHTPADRSMVDGHPMQKLTVSADEGKSWAEAKGSVLWKYQGEELVSFTSDMLRVPIPAKNVVFDMNVTPWIVALDALGASDEVTIAGSATFDIVYL